MTEWPLVPLDDLCDRITVGHVGPMVDEYVEDGVPFLRSQNILPFRINTDNLKFIPQSFHQKLRKSALRPGDVAVVRTGYPGTAAVVPQWLADANCADLVVITPGSGLDPFFLAAVFNSTWGIASVGGRLVGSAQQHFNVGAARRMELHVPPLGTQRKIATILSAYDDLIDNNNRRIMLLGEMARRIYREWFVDFRYPGHADVPLVDSEIGAVPNGWQVQALSEMSAAVTRGISPKYADASDQLVVNQRCIRNGSLDLSPARPHGTTVPAGKMVRLGDVLINSTGVGTLGRVAQVLFETDGLTVDSHVTILRPAPDVVTNDFLGLTLLEREQDLAAMDTGSTGQTELGRVAIGGIKVVVPPLRYQERFSDFVGGVRSLPLSLAEASATLRATRDLLLPRLMSGAIDVADLDIAMPEVAA